MIDIKLRDLVLYSFAKVSIKQPIESTSNFNIPSNLDKLKLTCFTVPFFIPGNFEINFQVEFHLIAKQNIFKK